MRDLPNVRFAPEIGIGGASRLRPPGRRRRSPAPGSHRTWRADFPHHALRQLVHSFHCYLFKFRFHGQPKNNSNTADRLPRPAVLPFPLRDRVGRSDHVRFRGYFPVHLIPAYNLPVYSSQRPLPDTTQDSVRGCSLGFTAATISDGRLQRACKAQLSQTRNRSVNSCGDSSDSAI